MEEIELIERAKKNDSEAIEKLVQNYSPILNSIVRRYFLVGGDSEDLMQEAMIGFWNAISSYNENESASFKTFVNLCVTRRVQSAIRKDNSQKNKVLNDSLSVDKDEEESGYDMYFFLPEQRSPEDVLIDKEHDRNIKQRMKELLSAYQFEVLELYLQGNSYSEIAEKFGKTSKDIDNALMSIKRTLSNLKNEDL